MLYFGHSLNGGTCLKGDLVLDLKIHKDLFGKLEGAVSVAL